MGCSLCQLSFDNLPPSPSPPPLPPARFLRKDAALRKRDRVPTASRPPQRRRDSCQRIPPNTHRPKEPPSGGLFWPVTEKILSDLLAREKQNRTSVHCLLSKTQKSPLPGDVENRKAAAVPRCFILQNKARLGRNGGSLRGEGEPFARQQKGSPSPLK